MHTPFPHKKSLGQHFLTSAQIPNVMCDAAEVVSGDIVLEIGPGTGALTTVLLARGATVVALEADQRAIDVLEQAFSREVESGQLTIKHADVRTLDLATISELAGNTYKVVANIPYYLSGLLFRTVLETEHQPSTVVFLVQKEVAKRATSDLKRNEKESLLSLSIKAYGTPHYVQTVARGHFNPPPKVDSAVISIANISRQHFTELDETFFFELLHLGFGNKRKQLLGNLSNRFSRQELETTLTNLELPLTIRAEDMPLETWLKLATALQTASTN